MRQLCHHGQVSVDTISTARRWSMLAIALSSTLFANVFINGVAFLIPTLHEPRARPRARRAALGDAQHRHGVHADRVGLCGGSRRRAPRARPRVRVDRGRRVRRGRGGVAHCSPASSCSSAEWPPPAATPPAVASSSAGSPRSAAVWPWASAKPRSHFGVGLGALVIPRLAQSHGIGTALLFPAIVCAVSAVVSAVGVLDPPRPPREQAPRRTSGQSIPGIVGVVAHPRGVGALGGAAGGGVDVHAGVADDRPRLVGRLGRSARHGCSSSGAVGRVAAGRWSDRGRIANASDPDDRGGRGRRRWACWRSPTS